jgi:hypothetical protein
MIKPNIQRKFQVCRSHLLDFAHLSRLLCSIAEKNGAERVGRGELREATGLPDGQVESLINIAVAMGLVERRIQTLTSIGRLIVKHDIFFDDRGTLEWCHYAGAGSYRNLFWFDAFNHLLVEEEPMTIEGWQKYFSRRLSGRYSDKSIKNQVPKEVRFVIKAYLEGNFRKMELLREAVDGRLYRRRYTEFDPRVFCATIYDFCATHDIRIPQVGEMAITPGSPAVLFGLDVATFRQQVESLHDRGWLRYETTHNLDQIRLKPGYSAIGCLAAHFEDREPQGNDSMDNIDDSHEKSPQGNLFE